MVANLESIMAGRPRSRGRHNALWALFEGRPPSAIERNVVLQTANFENECTSCVPWHTLLCERAGLAPEALRRFARTMIQTRGRPMAADLGSFYAAGYTPQQGMDVVLGIALKTMTNHTNGIAGTPLDDMVKDRA